MYWEIRANAANNTPGAVLFSGTSMRTHTATGNHESSPGHYPEFEITFDIGTVSLPAGTYWLVIHNGPLSYTATIFTDNIVWETTTSNRSDSSFADEAPFTNNWETNHNTDEPYWQLAFQLNGVPESFRPRITLVDRNMGSPRISFTTMSGQQYRVDYKNNLTDAMWTTVSGGANVTGTGNVVQVTDMDPNIHSFTHRFYRVVLL